MQEFLLRPIPFFAGLSVTGSILKVLKSLQKHLTSEYVVKL